MRPHKAEVKKSECEQMEIYRAVEPLFRWTSQFISDILIDTIYSLYSEDYGSVE